jgi:hypothetical protein
MSGEIHDNTLLFNIYFNVRVREVHSPETMETLEFNIKTEG